MTYRVVITPLAKHQLEMYIAYAANQFQNKQAARAIRDDAKATKKELEKVAGALPLCTDDITCTKWLS